MTSNTDLTDAVVAGSPYLNRPLRSLTDLGPNQLAWLKANVPQFGPAKEAADRALAHAAEIAEKLEPTAS